MNELITNPLTYAIGAGVCIALAMYVGKRQKAKEAQRNRIASFYDKKTLESVSEKALFKHLDESKNIPNSENGQTVTFRRAYRNVTVLDPETFDPIPEETMDAIENMHKEMDMVLGVPAGLIGDDRADALAHTMANEYLERYEKSKPRPDGSQMTSNPIVGDQSKAGWKMWTCPVVKHYGQIVKVEA